MPDEQSGVSETSPLLSKIRGLEPNDGLTPEGGLVGSAADSRPIHSADEDGLERQATSGNVQDGAQQYEGLPDVRKRMKFIFPSIAIGVFLSAADQTIIVSSYGKIGSELNALNQTSWIATAYFLTLTAFQPLYGKLSDIFGRKSCLLFGYTIFGIGCLGCGLAQNIQQLIAARAFAGVGGSAMTTVVSILMSDTIPLRERGTWQGYINIVHAAGSSAGAPLGGILADSAVGWRWAFLAQAPICLIAFTAVALSLHLPNPDRSNWREKLRRIDFLGSAVLISAVFLLLLGLDRGSNVSWKEPIALVPLCVSVPFFALFVLVENKVANEPIAPRHIIFGRAMVACYMCNFFAVAGWLSTLFYIPLYFQAVDHVSATGAGLRLLPSVIAGVSGSLYGGFYIQRTGHYYWLTIRAFTFLVIGMAIIFLCSGIIVNSAVAVIIGMCVCAFSGGIGITTTLIGIIANASREDQAVATACSYLFRSMGSVFGISLSATVANQTLRKLLSQQLPAHNLPGHDAAEIADGVRASLGYLEKLDPKVRAIVVDCYGRSASAAFALQIVLMLGAAGSAWFIHEKVLVK